MKNRLYPLALILFFSGFCSLVYQIVWLREMRLIFGASTPASAVVVSVFMGGLGLGGAIFGRRVDKAKNPLLFYSYLEFGIAAFTALTPFLTQLAQSAYITLGGSLTLGMLLATLVRLALATLVLAGPTTLMGGTLPAAARAAERDSDFGRRNLALLYGLNTLGATLGAFCAVFFFLEFFGARDALWFTCLLNLLLALSARRLALSKGPQEEEAPPALAAAAKDFEERAQPAASPGFVYLAAFMVGFAFFTMELVWYRMLAPVLGGSTYTFGLILVVALLGIGLGGYLYSLRSQRVRPTSTGFALTCGLEALFMAIPFALGDRLALLSAGLHPLSALGFFAHVGGWALICGLVVLPAAVLAGYQFPLLIGLLGSGREGVGRHTGYAYAFNTAGAILGALAGAFLFLPVLGATLSWRILPPALALLGLFAAMPATGGRSRKHDSGTRRLLPPMWRSASLLAVVVACSAATGPTAAWRHQPIGAGRVSIQTPNSAINAVNETRNNIIWQDDGLESSIGLSLSNSFSLINNGKSDSNVYGDKSTLTMLGLLGALLHPQPQTSLVVGMGTGVTAGWLTQVPSMREVVVVELEEAVLEVARSCSEANFDVLEDPKTRNIIADAREVLLTLDEKYDLIVSEPSNPYRAGIASLYTAEFYQAVSDRMNPGAVFTQWVQGYEIDSETLLILYKTLDSVFPWVQTWQSQSGDLMLLCWNEKPAFDLLALSRRLEKEPYASGLLYAWGVNDLHGVFSRLLANAAFTRHVAALDVVPGLNTDDRMLVEYRFARSVGKERRFNMLDILDRSTELDMLVPEGLEGRLDLDTLAARRSQQWSRTDGSGSSAAGSEKQTSLRNEMVRHFTQKQWQQALDAWDKLETEPVLPSEFAMLAECHGMLGHEDEARNLLGRLETWWPAAAVVLRARFAQEGGEAGQALEHLQWLADFFRKDFKVQKFTFDRFFETIDAIGEEHPELVPELAELLEKPFRARLEERQRQFKLLFLLKDADPAAAAALLESYEPHPFWNYIFLMLRMEVYAAVDHPLRQKALDDLFMFMENRSFSFGELTENMAGESASGQQLEAGEGNGGGMQ